MKIIATIVIAAAANAVMIKVYPTKPQKSSLNIGQNWLLEATNDD